MMPVYSTVFHNTNLAETKGSGIRAMRKLMEKAHLVPPTFESSRENNECVSRLLFHHFLDANDLECLNQFGKLTYRIVKNKHSFLLEKLVL